MGSGAKVAFRGDQGQAESMVDWGTSRIHSEMGGRQDLWGVAGVYWGFAGIKESNGVLEGPPMNLLSHSSHPFLTNTYFLGSQH